MREIKVDIEINASAERVWSILTDFASYHEWNPFIREGSGVAEEGQRLRLVVAPPENKTRTFRPKVLQARSPNYQPPYQLRWRGRLLVPGLFDGEHYFIIQPLGANKVKLTHGEVFTGLLVNYFWEPLLHVDTRRGFGEMNLALRERAEKQA
jgi:hypothetical protein